MSNVQNVSSRKEICNLLTDRGTSRLMVLGKDGQPRIINPESSTAVVYQVERRTFDNMLQDGMLNRMELRPGVKGFVLKTGI